MSINNIIDNACDTLRSSNCSGAMQYIPELTWLLFLKILDMTEQREAIEEKATGGTYNYSLESPYNWHEWAKGQIREEYKSKSEGSYIGFVNNDLTAMFLESVYSSTT